MCATSFILGALASSTNSSYRRQWRRYDEFVEAAKTPTNGIGRVLATSTWTQRVPLPTTEKKVDR